MAPRATWKGNITFGMVSIPVGLTGAVTEQDLKFNQFVKATVKVEAVPPLPAVLQEELHPVGKLDVDKAVLDQNQIHLVARQDVLRGYRLGDDIILITDEELDALAPKASRVIDVTSFVPVEDIDPIFYAKHYYAFPQKGAERAYALMVEALRNTERAGIASLVQRSKEYLVAVRSVDGALVVSYLNYNDEVKSVDVLDLDDTATQAHEVALAEALIGAMSGEWKPEDYEDTQRHRVLALIAAKAAGVAPETAPEPEAEQPMDSLLAALQASIDIKSKK